MANGRTDCAVRDVRAAPHDVYRAFVDPESLCAWLPPEGMRGELLAFDARAGGGYVLRLVYADGGQANAGKSSADSDLVRVRFEELVPGRRIVQSAEFEADDPAFAGTMRMTWTFDRVGDGTRVTIICENVPEGIGQEDHQAGLASSLANLARFVEA